MGIPGWYASDPGDAVGSQVLVLGDHAATATKQYFWGLLLPLTLLVSTTEFDPEQTPRCERKIG